MTKLSASMILSILACFGAGHTYADEITTTNKTLENCTTYLSDKQIPEEDGLERFRVNNSHHSYFVNPNSFGFYQMSEHDYIHLYNLFKQYKSNRTYLLKNEIVHFIRKKYLDLYYLYDNNKTLYQIAAEADKTGEILNHLFTRMSRHPKIKLPQLIYDLVRSDQDISQSAWDVFFDLAIVSLDDLIYPPIYRSVNLDLNATPKAYKINQMIRAALRAKRFDFLELFLKTYKIKGYLALLSPAPEFSPIMKQPILTYALFGKQMLKNEIFDTGNKSLINTFNIIITDKSDL